MNFKIQIIKEDVIEYFLHLNKKRMINKTLKFGSVIFAIFFGLIFIIDPKLNWYVGIAAICMILMGFFAVPHIMKIKARNTYRSDKNFQYPIEINISTNQIEIVSKYTNSKTQIDSLYEIEETTNLFLLAHNKSASFIIPKRNLNENQIIKLREIKDKKPEYNK